MVAQETHGVAQNRKEDTVLAPWLLEGTSALQSMANAKVLHHPTPQYLSGRVPVTTFSSDTMLGCCACCRMVSSRTDVTGSPSLLPVNRTCKTSTPQL